MKIANHLVWYSMRCHTSKTQNVHSCSKKKSSLEKGSEVDITNRYNGRIQFQIDNHLRTSGTQGNAPNIKVSKRAKITKLLPRNAERKQTPAYTAKPYICQNTQMSRPYSGETNERQRKPPDNAGLKPSATRGKKSVSSHKTWVQL